jgi:hypothetical protein
MPHVFELRIILQPRGELFAPGCGDLVNDASGAAFGGSAARPQKLLLLQPFQARIDLAEFGGPEVSDPVVQDGLQVESAGGLAEQTKQNMFETHGCHYITYYINVNYFRWSLATLRFHRFAKTGVPAVVNGRACGFTSGKNYLGFLWVLLPIVGML